MSYNNCSPPPPDPPSPNKNRTDADGMENSVDPVWSGSTLFAQTSLSENLGTLQ